MNARGKNRNKRGEARDMLRELFDKGDYGVLQPGHYYPVREFLTLLRIPPSKFKDSSFCGSASRAMRGELSQLGLVDVQAPSEGGRYSYFARPANPPKLREQDPKPEEQPNGHDKTEALPPVACDDAFLWKLTIEVPGQGKRGVSVIAIDILDASATAVAAFGASTKVLIVEPHPDAVELVSRKALTSLVDSV